MCQPPSVRTRKVRTHRQDILRASKGRFRCLCYAIGLALWFAGRRPWISGESRRSPNRSLPAGAYTRRMKRLELDLCLEHREAERSWRASESGLPKKNSSAARPRVCDSPAAPAGGSFIGRGRCGGGFCRFRQQLRRPLRALPSVALLTQMSDLRASCTSRYSTNTRSL